MAKHEVIANRVTSNNGGNIRTGVKIFQEGGLHIFDFQDDELINKRALLESLPVTSDAVEILVPVGTVIAESSPGEGPVYIVNILADYPGTGLHPKTWYGKPNFSGGGEVILSIEYKEFCKYRENRSGDGGTLTYIEYFFDNFELDGADYKTTQDYIIILSI